MTMVDSSTAATQALAPFVWVRKTEQYEDNDASSVSSLDSEESSESDEPKTPACYHASSRQSPSPRTPTRSSGRRTRQRSSLPETGGCRKLHQEVVLRRLASLNGASFGRSTKRQHVRVVKLQPKPVALRDIMASMDIQEHFGPTSSTEEIVKDVLTLTSTRIDGSCSSRWTNCQCTIGIADQEPASVSHSSIMRRPSRQKSGHGFGSSVGTISTHSQMTNSSVASFAADNRTNSSVFDSPGTTGHSPATSMGSVRSRRRFSSHNHVSPRLSVADTSSLRRHVRSSPCRGLSTGEATVRKTRLQTSLEMPRLPNRQHSSKEKILLVAN